MDGKLNKDKPYNNKFDGIEKKVKGQTSTVP